MRLEVFLSIFLAVLCFAQDDSNSQRSTRTPQGHIVYDDPDGNKVSWKLFAPYSQWRSHLESIQSGEKSAQAETVPEPKLAKPQEPKPEEKQQQQQQQQSQIQEPVQYKPYSMVPSYIKQLIFKMYEPQGPYVDPRVYIYHMPHETHSDDQPRSAQSQPSQSEQTADRRQESVPQETENSKEPVQQRVAYQEAAQQEAISYQEALQQRTAASYQYPVRDEGHIEYKSQDSESKPAQYGSLPKESAPQPELPAESTKNAQQPEENKNIQDNGMPFVLQQLLNLQAQTPYYVIANRISYKPKKMFIPKPIAENENGAYTYRTKVYYLRDDDVDQEDKSVKHVKEVQRH